MIASAPEQGKFLLYTAPIGAVKIDVFFQDESVWLTQKALAELFGVKTPAINKHLKNIFESGELAEAAVISILETTASDGKAYQTKYYNLDAITKEGLAHFQAAYPGVKTDKDSGIVNDANLWATETMENPKYPLELFQRVVTESLKTMKIVNSLPALEERS